MASPTIAMLGLGNWGTALANHLACKGHQVTGWSVEKNVVDSINSTHRNARYLSDVDLNERISATSNLDDVRGHDVLIFAFPSSALGQIVPTFTARADQTIISVIKGFEEASLLTPTQFVAQSLGSQSRCAVLSGPSFARDVVVRRPCGIVAASTNLAVAETVAELFNSDSMKVYLSTDAIGVEIGGAVKNVIALAAGVCDGLRLGDSARAGLVTRGLAEMMRLARVLGGQDITLAGLSGLGDLVMTASSDLSRNRTVGLRLGAGEKLSTIVGSLGSVAEGVKTTPLVMTLARRHGVDMPITAAVERLLSGELSPQQLVRELMTRPTRREFD